MRACPVVWSKRERERVRTISLKREREGSECVSAAQTRTVLEERLVDGAVGDASRELDVEELLLVHAQQELLLGVFGQILELGRPSQNVALSSTRGEYLFIIYYQLFIISIYAIMSI
jgi:hypothetical protein